MKENKLIYRDPFGAPKTISSNVDKAKEVVELENDIKALNDNRTKWERDKKVPNLDKDKKENLKDLENTIRAETQSILNRLNYYSTGGIDSPINDVHREVDFRGLDINKIPKITKKTRTNFTDFTIITLKPEKGIHVRMSKTKTQTLSKSIYKDKSINGGILSHSIELNIPGKITVGDIISIEKARSKKDMKDLDTTTWRLLNKLMEILGKPNNQPIKNIRDAYSNTRQRFMLPADIPEIIDKGGYLIIKYKDYGLEKLSINIKEGKVIYTQKTVIKPKKPLIKPKKKPLTKAETEKAAAEAMTAGIKEGMKKKFPKKETKKPHEITKEKIKWHEKLALELEKYFSVGRNLIGKLGIPAYTSKLNKYSKEINNWENYIDQYMKILFSRGSKEKKVATFLSEIPKKCKDLLKKLGEIANG